MHRPAIFCVGARFFTGTGDISAGKANLRAFEFCPSFCGFRPIPAHDVAFPADGNPFVVNCEIIFVNRGASPIGIQVNEWGDPMVTAVLIVRHGIVCRVQKQFCNVGLWQELLKREPVIEKADGIMPGSRAKERENRQVVFRIGGGEHIQVIAEIVTLPVGIPPYVTVWLAIAAVTLTVPDPFFQAVTGSFFPFPGGSIDRGAIAGKGEVQEIDQTVLDRAVQEEHFKYVIESLAGCYILWWMGAELREHVFHGNFLHGRGLFPFFVWFLRLFLRRMDRIREIIFIRKPKTAKKIIKSPNARGIANKETGKDGMEMVLLKVSGPLGIGRELEFHGKQDRAEHIRGEPWCGSEDRIAVSHESVQLGEVKCPEFFHDIPSGSRQGGSSIRIIFTELCQDMFLVGGMSARIIRFQKIAPNQKVCSGRAGTNYLVNQGARSAAFLSRFVNSFLKKSGGIYKNGVLEAA